jgi:hypothetical protein
VIERAVIVFFTAWYVFALFYITLFSRTSNSSQFGIVLAGVIVYTLELSAGYTAFGLFQTALTIMLFKVMCHKPLPGKVAFKLFSVNGLAWVFFNVSFRTIFALPIVIFHQAALQYALSSTASISVMTLRYLGFQLLAANWFYLFYPLPIFIWYAATFMWRTPKSFWIRLWRTTILREESNTA